MASRGGWVSRRCSLFSLAERILDDGPSSASWMPSTHLGLERTDSWTSSQSSRNESH